MTGMSGNGRKHVDHGEGLDAALIEELTESGMNGSGQNEKGDGCRPFWKTSQGSDE